MSAVMDTKPIKKCNTKRFPSTPRTIVKFSNNAVSNISIESYLINDTNYNIIALTRENVPISLPILQCNESLSTYLEVIIYRRVFRFYTLDAIKRTIKNISDIEDKSEALSNDCSILKTTLNNWIYSNQVITPYYPDLKVTIDKYVPVQELLKTGVLYMSDADILLQLDQNNSKVFHPYSNEGVSCEKIRNITQENGCCGVLVEIVDNNDSIGKRFMFSGKNIVEINPIKNNEKDDGVYIYTLNVNNNESDIVSKRISLEEASSSIGLYKNKEEAMAGGDPKILKELELCKENKELLEKKKELEQMRLEYQKAETKHKEEVLRLTKLIEEEKRNSSKTEFEYKKKLSDLEEEHKKREYDLKEKYEKQSYERKKQADKIKNICAIGGSIIGLAGTLATIYSKSKK